MIEYRAYQPQDLAAVMGLFRETVHTVCCEDYSQKELEAWAPDEMDEASWGTSLLRHDALTAWKDGELVGFADLDGPEYFDRLYVSSRAQRQGVAKGLAERLEQRAKELGVKKIEVHASRTAKGFFLHRGYRLIRANQVERCGVILENFLMEKEL